MITSQSLGQLTSSQTKNVNGVLSKLPLSPRTHIDLDTEVNIKTFYNLYEGSKFFWRHRCNIDLAIYGHPEFNTFEIIAYDAEKSIELNRIYLKKSLVEASIYETLQGKINEERQILSQERFKKNFDEKGVHEKYAIILSNQFILDRLNLDMGTNDTYILRFNSAYGGYYTTIT